jgi:MFS family permease
LQWAPLGAFDFIALLRGLAPWRTTFVLVGSFGFLVAAMMLLLREPTRQGNAAESMSAKSVRSTFAQFGARRRFFLPMYGSLATFAMGTAAVSGWGAVLLTRNFGFTAASAGKGLGTGQILWATLGAVIASLVVDRVARRAGTTGKIKLAAALALLAIPACMAGLTGAGILAVALLSATMFVSAIYGATMLSVTTEVAPANARGLAVALYAFVMTMIGGSLAPLGVAFLTERVFHDPHAVAWSMAIVGTAALSLSALLSMTAARELRSGH